jgi:hypothetical protein
VDGELHDAKRRELLLQLEREPDGWRRCALAFLEAQTWRQSLTSVVAPYGVARPESSKGVSSGFSTPLVSSPGRATRSRFWRPLARVSGLAAGLAAAFALGWVFHRAPEVTAPDAGSVSLQVVSVADRSIQPAPQPAVKTATGHSNPTKPAEAAASIDPIVKTLQQRGYSIETQQRLVLMESKDGRKVKLPVQELRIRYTADRIY